MMRFKFRQESQKFEAIEEDPKLRQIKDCLCKR